MRECRYEKESVSLTSLHLAVINVLDSPPNACGQRHDGWARLLPPAKGVNTRRVRCTALLDGFLADASNAEQSYELLNDKMNAEASATLDWLPATPQQWPNTRISIDGIHSMTWTRCSLPLCTTWMLYQRTICREAYLLVNDRTPSNYRETNSMS